MVGDNKGAIVNFESKCILFDTFLV